MLPTRRLLIPLSATLVGALSFPGCDDIQVIGAEAASVEVTPAAVTIEIDQTRKLEAVVRSADGAILGGQEVLWSSGEPTIVSVTTDGDIQGLAPGNSTVVARVGSATGSAVVTVETLPNFALSRTTAQFAAIQGDSDGPESVDISGTGSNPATGLAIRVSYVQEVNPWLQPTLSNTSTPASLNMNASTVGLAPGDYQAVVTISANRVPSQNVQITLTVLPPPSIALSVNSASFTAAQGSTTPDSDVILITNSGAASITGMFAIVFYGAGQPGNWLSTNLSSTTAPSQLTLSATAASLLPGTYTATVQLQSPDAVNSPVDIPVTFVVTP